MTIDEAIQHCKEKQKLLNEQACSEDMTEKEAADCFECATEHLQLATWLEELQELRKLQAERPQGEWIDYSEEGFVECPFCHKATTCEDNIDELHYCWNCGAKMKGGAE